MVYASGPDISFYQDDKTTPAVIDFNKMKAHADFVIIRAGQNEWLDPDFKRNWAAAKKAGLPRGSYWFYDSRVKPKRQAELWRDALGDDQGELPLCADFEENYGGPYAGWEKWYTFLENLKELMPNKEVIIYTAYYYWRDNAPNATTQAESLEYFHQYPLWIASYSVGEPSVPKPWGAGEWMLWQYTEKGDGAAFGVESAGIDLNYFNGSPAEFRARFNLVDGGGDEGGIVVLPAKKMYKVDLSLREGPSDVQKAIATLAQDELLEKLEGNADGSWLKVRRANGQFGWVSTSHLRLQESDTVIVSPPPEKWYLVNVPALNVRQGPSTQFDIAGKVVQNDLLEKIETDESERWFKIRNLDGLVGWVYAAYLTETEAPADEEPVSAPDPKPDPDTETDTEDEPDTAPVPDPADDPQNQYLGRFQVTAYVLNLREGPSGSSAIVGRLAKGDVIQAIDTTEDGSWRKIEKGDEVGWCSASYLVRHPAPYAARLKFFNGSVRYIREVFNAPRKMIVNILVVDTHYEKMNFLVTPPAFDSDAAPVCARSTSEFLEMHGVQVAINGDGYQHVNPAAVPGLSCPDGRDLLNPNSFAASRGKIYSQQWDKRPIMYVNANNEVTFNEPKGKVYNAISGDRMLVDQGNIPAGLDDTVLEPRTAVGVNQNGRWMILIVVDGRQPGYSEGCTLTELAGMLIKYGGVHNAINLDGGGSSTMVVEKNGAAEVLNSPIEGGIAGRQRYVANHFGIEIK